MVKKSVTFMSFLAFTAAIVPPAEAVKKMENTEQPTAKRKLVFMKKIANKNKKSKRHVRPSILNQVENTYDNPYLAVNTSTYGLPKPGF